jgi:hypothetical protein
VSTKTYIKTILLIGLVTLSIGGLLLHSRIHPATEKDENLIPAIIGVMGIVVVPALFWFKKTIAYAYVINGFAVIIGTITMAHFSIAHWPKETTVKTILLGTLLADILILWGKFFIGKAVFDLEFFGYDAGKEKKGKTYRYPNMGWWMVHLAGVSVVYYLGNVLWK